jgi:hypothetical protein
MIPWASLAIEQRLYVLEHADEPLACFVGIPAARASAEKKLGDPDRWLLP